MALPDLVSDVEIVSVLMVATLLDENSNMPKPVPI